MIYDEARLCQVSAGSASVKAFYNRQILSQYSHLGAEFSKFAAKQL
jgi:hypothetical protein